MAASSGTIDIGIDDLQKQRYTITKKEDNSVTGLDSDADLGIKKLMQLSPCVHTAMRGTNLGSSVLS